MENIDKTICLDLDITIKEAIKKIDLNAKKTLFFCDENRVLLGVVTDGDIRRWILENKSLEEKISMAMNRKPIHLHYLKQSEAKEMMLQYKIEALPIVNDEGQIVHMVYWSDLFHERKSCSGKRMDVDVVIMAGGKGSRLYPYTKILPKPLIPIGEIPISERIINKFHEFGCQRFHMVVNYKKNMIKSYFSDVDRKYSLSYLDEEIPLGTAGSLFLFRNQLKESFFLSNCDILVDADYASIYDYHRKQKNKLTIVTSLKNYIIPYGVISISKDSQVISLQEKPENHYLVNTGMYVIEPEILQYIPEGEFYHMTDLIHQCMENGIRVGTYPVSEAAWLDMGEFSQMKIMREKLEEEYVEGVI